MSKSEKAAVLSINNTIKPYESQKSVIEIFEEVVGKHSNDIALIFEEQKMTYAELDRKSNNIAMFLKENGIVPNDKVAICIDKSFNLIIGILAVLKCGACYVPLDANYSDDRKKYILEESNVKLCLCDESFNLNFKSINITDISADLSMNKLDSSSVLDKCHERANFKPCYGNGSTPICILYTSGTTGNPKGVEIISSNIVKLVKHAI